MSHFTRVANLLRGPSLEREFDDEIRFHLEERLRRNVAAGMTPEAAEGDAQRRFGSIERAKAGMRAARLARPSVVALALLAATIFFAAAGAMYFGTRERIYDVTSDVSDPVRTPGPQPHTPTAAIHERFQAPVASK